MQESVSNWMKPRLMITPQRNKYQMREVCLSPYNDLLRRKTLSENCLSRNPSDCVIYISTSLLSCRKAFLQSTCKIWRSLAVAIAKMILIDSILTTGANVSLKSRPAIWENPLIIILALYFSKKSLTSRLTLNTHLRGIALLLRDKSISFHVLFWITALISSIIACHQSL